MIKIDMRDTTHWARLLVGTPSGLYHQTREAGDAGPEGGSDLHALENEIHAEAIPPLHALGIGADVILFADILFGPLGEDVMAAGKGVYPAVVVVGATAQHFLGDGVEMMDVTEEMNDVLRPGQQGMCPRMTMRSKQWYTKASRLPA